MSAFWASLNNVFIGQNGPQNHIHRLGEMTLFDCTVACQVTIIMLNVLSALAASIVKYLSPWPMLLMALLLFIPIFPSLCSSQQEEILKWFGWTQLILGFVELFWSSCVLFDMHYHPNDWRAYFTMCTVSWQFMSIILISMDCPLLEKVINGGRSRRSTENSTVTEPSSYAVDFRIEKLRKVLHNAKQRLDERNRQREERLNRDQSRKSLRVKEIDLRTTRKSSDQTANKISDLSTAKEQSDENKKSEDNKE